MKHTLRQANKQLHQKKFKASKRKKKGGLLVHAVSMCQPILKQYMEWIPYYTIPVIEQSVCVHSIISLVLVFSQKQLVKPGAKSIYSISF